ncbi:putative HTH-type transcriptional regulator [Nymphon striatum]|nr:putative HTH-type transcriptional regulator [Nymphon striatum]
MRHAFGRANKGASKRAPNPNNAKNTTDPPTAPTPNTVRSSPYCAAIEPSKITVSRYTCGFRKVNANNVTATFRQSLRALPSISNASVLVHAERKAITPAPHGKGLEGGLPQSGAKTPVRIAVNADSLATWFLPALAEHDDFLFDLNVDDQDHSADWLRSGEVAAAITGHAGPVRGCDSYPLGAMRYYATASPSYMAHYMPNGPTREALETAPAMTFDDKDRLQSDWANEVTNQIVTLQKHRLASTQGFVLAARLGMGWGMNPESLCKDALSSGDLVEVKPNTPMDVPLYWQVSRLTAKPLRLLTRSILQHAQAALIQ